MEYTRALFIQLLEKHFGKVLEDRGRHFLKDFENREVAELLDYDKRQFGNCLNPKDNTSYKTVIKRLLTYDKMKELERKVEDLENKNNRLQSNNKKAKRLNKWLLMATIGAIAIAIIGTLWLSKRYAKEVASNDETTFTIKDKLTLDRIVEHHGKLMVYRLFYEAVRINDMMKNNQNPVSDSVVAAKTISYITTAMVDGRKDLQDIGFVNKEGVNIVQILNEEYPTNSLFQGESSLFSSAVDKVTKHLKDPKVNWDTLLKEISNGSNEARTDQWNRVWEVGWKNAK